MSTRDTIPARRSGPETRALALDTAVRLFTEQGYEATSLRQIADEIGINKASLYYYFDSKQAILDAAFDKRGDEAEQLLAWLAEQAPRPGLVDEAVMRWVESFSSEKLNGIRFMAANPHLGRNESSEAGGDRIGTGLGRFADGLTRLLPDPSPENGLMLRMALLSINAAVHAASRSGYADDVIVGAATRAARALLQQVGQEPA